MKRLFVIAALAILSACSSLGLQPAQSPSQGIAYAYSTVTAVRTSAAQALTAGTITAAQAQQVLALTDQARTSLDAGQAVVVAAGTAAPTTSQAQVIAQDLSIATALLTQAAALIPK